MANFKMKQNIYKTRVIENKAHVLMGVFQVFPRPKTEQVE